MGIEIAGRLVRDQQRRPVDQGASDCGPLLFAAAQLMNEMVGAFRQPDEANPFVRALFALARRNSLEQQRQRYVFAHIHRRQEIEELEYETDLPAAELRQGPVVR